MRRLQDVQWKFGGTYVCRRMEVLEYDEHSGSPAQRSLPGRRQQRTPTTTTKRASSTSLCTIVPEGTHSSEHLSAHVNRAPPQTIQDDWW